MNTTVTYNVLVMGFTSGRVTVYLKQSSEYVSHYAVKVMKSNGQKEFLYTNTNLSSAMRFMAETIDAHTGKFTVWNSLT